MIFSANLTSMMPLIAALVGACIGSFLSLVTYRFIHDQPIVTARSRCTSCGATLGARDLLPILSWLMMRGKARCCGARISLRYPLIELTCALSALLIIGAYGLTVASFMMLILCWCSAGLMLADLESYLLPDILLIPLALAGILYGDAQQLPASEILIGGMMGLGLGALLRYGGSYALRKEALGMGDVKLLAVCGIWLISPLMLASFMIISGVLGIMLALVWRMAVGARYFPFGPALLIALVVCVLMPDSIAEIWGVLR